VADAMIEARLRIYIWILRLSTLASPMRCFLFYNPGFQRERYHVIVPQLSYLAATIPLPARLLHLVL